MSTLLIIAILLLGFIVVFQIAKASEYVSVLKGEKKTFEQNNRINGFLLLAFMILGLIGVYWCNELFKGRILGEAASDHGEKIDTMLYITIALTGVVFVITQILLFYFAFKYQHSEKRKAYYFPHDNRLEVLWTVVPAIALTILVGFGLFYWFKITGDPPKDATVVEVTGKQFGWVFRYPGKDKVFGKKYYKNIDEGKSNQLGLIWDDQAAHDDVVTNEALYLVVNKPVKIIINSRDVVHDLGLVHFRMKMDAVPGTPTTMWFTPKFTTAEMKEKTGNPDFEYEISCDQMCGKGHYSMKGIVKVVSAAEYALWLAKQKPNYVMVFPDKDPAAKPAVTDSTATAAVDNKKSLSN
ncbi:cytochrome c oxidase subunit II [Flavihumibacter profundi]|jgi:cytochrome c oxidase subunit II|uniref:cytochrome c oxidase subunit II n=1 Tax=Flavihumibacter profundi TaxID=2716883 RepID=UPI001CC6CCF8|nr:cytochrome c oxidase subunit II [Flavihumibacter profundi]MBZ5858973.1 cytochrome c oxidase subunit II [Flavihumibacter profundi]